MSRIPSNAHWSKAWISGQFRSSVASGQKKHPAPFSHRSQFGSVFRVYCCQLQLGDTWPTNVTCDVLTFGVASAEARQWPRWGPSGQADWEPSTAAQAKWPWQIQRTWKCRGGTNITLQPWRSVTRTAILFLTRRKNSVPATRDQVQLLKD